jgi:hypothetical protein
MAYSFFEEKDPGRATALAYDPCGKNTGLAIRLSSPGSLLEA